MSNSVSNYLRTSTARAAQPAADPAPAKDLDKAQARGRPDGTPSTLTDRKASAADAASASAAPRPPEPEAGGPQTALSRRDAKVGETGWKPPARIKDHARLDLALRDLITCGSEKAAGRDHLQERTRTTLRNLTQCTGFTHDELRAAIQEKCRNNEASAQFTPDLRHRNFHRVGGPYSSGERVLSEIRLGLNATQARHEHYRADHDLYVNGFKKDSIGKPTEEEVQKFRDGVREQLIASGGAIINLEKALSSLEKEAGIKAPRPAKEPIPD